MKNGRIVTLIACVAIILSLVIPTIAVAEQSPISGKLTCEKLDINNNSNEEYWVKVKIDGSDLDDGNIAPNSGMTIDLNFNDGNTHSGKLIFSLVSDPNQTGNFSLGEVGPCGTPATTEPPPPTETDPPPPTETQPPPTEEPTEEPGCTVQNLDVHADVEKASDTTVTVHGWATWDEGPNEVELDFWGADTRMYGKGNAHIPWHDVPMKSEAYSLYLAATAYEFFGGEKHMCARTKKEVVDVPALPTPVPTQPTEEPTEEPTATDPPKDQCTDPITHIKGRLFYTGNHLSGRTVKGEATNLSKNPLCQDKLYLLVFATNEEPHTDKWLSSQVFISKTTINVPPNTHDMSFEQSIKSVGYKWCQVDLLRTNKVRLPPHYVGDDMVDWVVVPCGFKPTPTPTEEPTETPIPTPTPTGTLEPTPTPTEEPTPPPDDPEDRSFEETGNAPTSTGNIWHWIAGFTLVGAGLLLLVRPLKKRFWV